MKKLLTVLLALGIILCLGTALVACDDEGTETHEHAYSTQVVAATCTEQGYTVYTCTCGHTYNGDSVNALGHEFTQYISDGNATCTADGTETANCNRTGCSEKDTRTDAESALGHSFGEWIPEQAAGCESDGVKGHFTCGVCRNHFDANEDLITDLTIPAVGHSLGTWIAEQAAGCETDGVKGHFTCGVCRNDFDANENLIADLTIPAVGHSLGAWVAEQGAGCETDGVKGHFTCGVCRNHFDANENLITDLTIPAVGHSLGAWVAEQGAGCETDGVKGHFTCGVCRNHFDANENLIADLTIPAVGHSLGAWIPEQAAGCETDGQKGHFTCDVCRNHFDANENPITDLTIPAVGHSHQTTAVIAPTCTKQGYTLYRCACGDTKQDDFVPATNHATPALLTYDQTYHYQTCACGAVIFEDTKQMHDFVADSSKIQCSCDAHSSINYLNFILLDGEYSVSVITKYVGDEIYIPAYYQGKPVTRITNLSCQMKRCIFAENSNVKYIEYGAFSECSKLESINLPNGLLEIGNDAFFSCTALTRLEIPSSVVKIGLGAFNGISERVFKTYCDAYYLGNSENRYMILVRATSWAAMPTIHENTRLICPEAMRMCYNLYSVTIPKSVEYIGQSAFDNCRNLSTVLFEADSQLKEIGKYAFANNPLLAQLVLPDGVTFVDGCVVSHNTVLAFTEYENGKYIGTATNPYLIFCGAINDATTLTLHKDTKFLSAYLYNSCPSLVSIEIPEGVVAIGAETFSNMSSLESVKLPSTLTFIGDRAFQYCSALKSISIPKGVKVIYEWTFAYCNELTTVTFEAGSELKQIDQIAFYQCPKLTHVSLPESLRMIGNAGLGGNSFEGCTSLQFIVISPETLVKSQSFENCSAMRAVYFRGTAEEWETMKSTYVVTNGNEYILNVAVYFYSETQPAENGNYWHYDTDGETIVLW